MTKNWQQYANCSTYNAELFFPISETSGVGLLQIADARAICNYCPVRTHCLKDALTEEGSRPAERRFGIFAGFTPTQRHRIYRRLARSSRPVRETAAA